MSAFEDLSRGPSVEKSSDRTLGLVMSAVFLLAGLWPLIHGRPARLWAAGLAVAFLVVAFVRPSMLHPLNVAWTALAILLHRVVSPVVLGILFFAIVTPVALAMKLFRRDALRLRMDPSVKSYWIPRDPPGPEPGSLIHQF